MNIQVKIGGFDEIVGSRGETKTTYPLDKKYPNDLRVAPNYFERFPDIFVKNKDDKHTIKIVGLEKGNKRAERYVDGSIIRDPKLEKWKVFIPKSNGSGALGEVVSTPLTGCTYSFLQVGAFESRPEAENCMKYLKTRFCRVMLGTLKVTQDNPKSTWKNVPLQDFTASSDIDWSRSIAEIDQQLYAKYGLDQHEIDFIETRIKAME